MLFLNSQCGRWFPAPDSKFQSNTTSSASIEKINQNRKRSKHHPSEDHLALWARRLSNQSINLSSTCFNLFIALDFYLFLLCAYRVRSLMCMETFPQNVEADTGVLTISGIVESGAVAAALQHRFACTCIVLSLSLCLERGIQRSCIVSED